MSTIYYLTFTLFVSRFSFGDISVCNSTLEKPVSLQIREKVLCDYDKTIRPVTNKNATSLEIKLFIHHFDYEVYSNMIDIETWFGMRWKDDHIYWDPDTYNGVESIFLTSNEIWTPNLAVYNRGTYGTSKIIQNKAECLAFYHKKVVCLAQASIRGMCIPDLRFYPFDVQNCTLRIGSWFHTDSEINIIDTEVITNAGTYTHFSLNPEWNLESVTHEKVSEKSKNYPNETFSFLKFHFLIRRNAGAIFTTVIVPHIIMISLSVIILWMDPQLPDRIYVLSVALPLDIMFTLNTYWEVPETGTTVPYIVQVIRNSQIIVTLTLIETIIVRYFLQKTDESPKILVDIFRLITRYKIGQLFVFFELDPENAVENLSADDSTNLVEMKDKPKEWYLLGKVIDRLVFIMVAASYIIMFILYIPKY